MKDRIIFFLATKLGWLLILLLGKLTRIEYIGREHYERLHKSGKPYIILIWHGRILLPIYLFRKKNVHVIVSDHRDGEMIAQTIKKLGFTPVRGSSTRGGRKAALGIIRALRQGEVCSIMPDGPSGPRWEFKDGPLFIARKAGAFLLPLTFSSDKYIELRSWDRFIIWKPFSRSVAVYSEPIEVPKELSEDELEDLRFSMQEMMIDQQNEADAYFRE